MFSHPDHSESVADHYTHADDHLQNAVHFLRHLELVDHVNLQGKWNWRSIIGNAERERERERERSRERERERER